MKWVKFGVSRHFLENPLRKCSEILHADVSWPLSELIRLWLQFLIFLILMLFWLSETGKIWGFQAFWSCSVDFPHYGDPLADIGHMWSFWRTCGSKCRGEGGGIFPTLCVECCLVLYMRPAANERRCYIVTFLIGWVDTQMIPAKGTCRYRFMSYRWLSARLQ